MNKNTRLNIITGLAILNFILIIHHCNALRRRPKIRDIRSNEFESGIKPPIPNKTFETYFLMLEKKWSV